VVTEDSLVVTEDSLELVTEDSDSLEVTEDSDSLEVTEDSLVVTLELEVEGSVVVMHLNPIGL